MRQKHDGGLKSLFTRLMIKIFILLVCSSLRTPPGGVPSHTFHEIPASTFLPALKLCYKAGSIPMPLCISICNGRVICERRGQNPHKDQGRNLSTFSATLTFKLVLTLLSFGFDLKSIAPLCVKMYLCSSILILSTNVLLFP